MTKVGLLSDTHGYWDEKYLQYFEGCDEIWHAGDIGSLELAERLAAFRPLRAVYGNIDGQDLRPVHLMGNDPVQGNHRQECRQMLQVLTDGHGVVSTIRGTVERGILPLAATPPACGREGCHTGLPAEKLILQQFLICRQTAHCFSSSQSSSYS